MCDLYIVGEILRPHGNRGEVVVRPLTDNLSTLTKARRLFLGHTQEKPVNVLKVRIHKGAPIMLFEGVENMDQAEGIRGQMLCLPRDELLPLQDGEYFLHDLIGLTLLDHWGTEVGRVDRILETAGPPLLAGDKTGGGGFLVPFASGTIGDVDLKKGTITLTDLPGLVDEEDRV
jgi:16S rRNA processing protein RimM